ncbi:MAG: hypothetical protein ABL921_19195 [Pirellula sp.]
MLSNKLIRLLFLLALLVPMGGVAAWGVRHARPNLVWLRICQKDGNVYALGKQNLKQDSMLTCLNATTGEFTSVRLPRHRDSYSYSTGFDGDQLWTAERDSRGYHQIFAVSVPDLSITGKSTIEDERGEVDVCVVEHSVVQILSDVVTVQAIGTRVQSDSRKLALGADATLQQINGTRNVLASEKKGITGAILDFELLSVSDGKLTTLGRWQALDCNVNDLHSQKTITSLLSDGLTVETIDATVGNVICSISVPDNFGLRLPLSSLEGSWFSNWNQWNSGGMNVITEALSKAPKHFRAIWHDVERQRFYCVKEFDHNEQELTVVDQHTGYELFRLDLQDYNYRADAIEMCGDELLIATRNSRIAFYDVATGVHLRTIDPFRMVHWVNCICFIAFMAWCVLWSRLSIGVHSKGWIDSMAYTLPIFGYVFMRLQDQAGDRFAQPAICIVSFGVSVGLAMLASIWWALGKARWSFGALPPIVCTLFGLGFHSLTLGRTGIYTPYVIESVVLTSLAAAGFIAFLKFGPFRFCQEAREPADLSEISPESNEGRANMIPLRDLFLWTTVFGVFFAMLKGGLCIVALDVSLLLVACPLGLFLAFVASFALCLALYCSARVARRVARLSCGIAILCVLFADPAGRSLFPPAVVSVLTNGSFVMYLMPVWLTVFMGLYAYRLRGWRIVANTPCWPADSGRVG